MKYGQGRVLQLSTHRVYLLLFSCSGLLTVTVSQRNSFWAFFWNPISCKTAFIFFFSKSSVSQRLPRWRLPRLEMSIVFLLPSCKATGTLETSEARRLISWNWVSVILLVSLSHLRIDQKLDRLSWSSPWLRLASSVVGYHLQSSYQSWGETSSLVLICPDLLTWIETF